MKGAEGQRRRGFLKSLREIYLERQTGAFRILAEERPERLYFVGGELYLPPDHRLAIAAHQWLTSAAGYGALKDP